MSPHTFRALLWEHDADRPGSWHFLTLPGDVVDDVVSEAGPRRGFGSIRVEVTIGRTTWRTSLFPDSSSSSLVLPVRRQVRDAEGLEAGDACQVAVAVVG